MLTTREFSNLEMNDPRLLQVPGPDESEACTRYVLGANALQLQN